MKNFSAYRYNRNRGQAALVAVIFFLFISLALVGAFANTAVQESKISQVNLDAKQSYNLAEAGVEDASWRIIKGKNYTSPIVLILNGVSATTIVTNVGVNSKMVTASGDVSGESRRISTSLTPGGTSVNFYYGVQVGDGGLEMENSSSVVGNIYSNGSVTGSGSVTGDVIVAGGLSTNPAVSWTVDDSDFSFATASGNRDVAQSFIANATGAANQIGVYLSKAGSPGSNITLRLTTDNSGKPNRSSLASVSLPNTSVGATPSWIYTSFSSAPNLTNGTKYWIVLDYNANSVTNYWKWGKDSTDGYANNTAKYTADWSSSSAVWTSVGGDLDFQVWIGGTANQIGEITIGNSLSGTGRANVFDDTTIHGSSCPNQYCIVENPARQNMPISDGVIQDWKNEAAAGGTISGDYSVTTDTSLGPVKITGDLLITSNKKTLTVTGVIYVQGNISFDNLSTIRCSPSYQLNSCLVISDGWIHVKNNGVFSGSGQAGSYIMLVSPSPCDGSNLNPPCDTAHHHGSIDLHNSAEGAIFYAPHGLLNLHNTVHISEATAYRIDLDNNAVVTYESGLANANFSSGPGAGWQISNWQEVQ